MKGDSIVTSIKPPQIPLTLAVKALSKKLKRLADLLILDTFDVTSWRSLSRIESNWLWKPKKLDRSATIKKSRSSRENKLIVQIYYEAPSQPGQLFHAQNSALPSLSDDNSC